MTTVDKIADAIRDMTEVEVLEFAAMQFVSQVDAIQKADGDPAMQEQLAARMRDLAKKLKGLAETSE